MQGRLISLAMTAVGLVAIHLLAKEQGKQDAKLNRSPRSY